MTFRLVSEHNHGDDLPPSLDLLYRAELALLRSIVRDAGLLKEQLPFLPERSWPEALEYAYNACPDSVGPAISSAMLATHSP